MTFYSVVTVYPDHISTVDVPTALDANTEYRWRKAVVNSTDPENITVRIIRVSKHAIQDVTPGREN